MGIEYEGMKEHKEVVAECEGCKKINEDNKCFVYVDPGARHRICECPLKTTKTLEMKDDGKRKKVNPIKASKRKYRR